MSYTADPINSATDRLRLIIGDTDLYEEGLTDDVYNYVINKHDGNENQAALECLRYLVAKYASYCTEKAGGLFVKESDKFDQYSRLLKALTSNPATTIYRAGTPFAGGVYSKDIEDNYSNSGINHNISSIEPK